MSLKRMLSAENITLYLLILMLILLIIFSGRQLSALGDGREMLKLEEEALAADQARLLFLEGLAAEKPQLRLDLASAHRLIPQKAS
ncbi:MAG TPA: hypothetical protein DCQ14_05785, partial [Firmicutes bacterium]|nr:hypothetical protein [Bacillota bacterium]